MKTIIASPDSTSPVAGVTHWIDESKFGGYEINALGQRIDLASGGSHYLRNLHKNTERKEGRERRNRSKATHRTMPNPKSPKKTVLLNIFIININGCLASEITACQNRGSPVSSHK